MLKNVKVKTKLISAFLIVSMFIGIVGVVGGLSLKDVDKDAEEMYNNNLQSIDNLLSIKSNLGEMKGEILTMMYDEDPSDVIEAEKNIKNKIEECYRYLEEYEKLPMTSESKEILERFKIDVKKSGALRKGVMVEVKANNSYEAKRLYDDMQAVEKNMINNLDEFIEIDRNEAKLAKDNINSIYTRSNMVMISLSVLGVLMGILIGILTAKDIEKPLNKIKDLAERLSSYDLSTPINLTRKDEFAQTGMALNNAQENVKALVKVIMENSQDISASSEELSATAEELFSKAENIDQAIVSITSGTQETSATTEEISASTEEVDASISELSQKAMEGSNNANEFKERATVVKINSEKAIEETRKLYDEKEKMMKKAIEDGKVVDSIKVMADTIAGIAEQTNLLSLNAAIEAAKAGEQGRGFAVVAEEVRKLAEQSGQAVTNIKETIVKVQEAFKSSIDTGSDILEFINTNVHEQFNAYGKTGNQYYDDSDFVSNMSEEIAAMSEEITATVGQVSEAIQNMAVSAQKSSEEAFTIKEGIDETTKAIEQVALTAQSQAELAEKLNEMIQKFKI
ncbi:methyl-accepting chemotaxis protein [Clostridium sp. MSJ-4]|uniref:Methyl-accepting chemotaxis protein n=1 Tax=Clostridium simiarum TaxID=2841506 RepID=A0ABS6F3Z9_9CLOT|nr:methyl-accepting chemotaxis protein [Clostridium simiarum]MBU5593021.1 methyl-accepting chemotaxis protein [Clostridium simiarum]